MCHVPVQLWSQLGDVFKYPPRLFHWDVSWHYEPGLVREDPHPKESSRISIQLAELLDKITSLRAFSGDAKCSLRLLACTSKKMLMTGLSWKDVSKGRELAPPQQPHGRHTAAALRGDLKTEKKICRERRSYFHFQVTKKAFVTAAALQTQAPYCLQRHPWQPLRAAWR